MEENKMKEVAQLLGVELDKPFKVKDYGNEFILTGENGLMDLKKSRRFNGVFVDLLLGEDEIEKQILDDVEKRYLECVLRPFKDDVIYVKKTLNHNYERIVYKVKTFYGYNFHSFPDFKHTMYKGMEVNKKYTLKELGLFEED